MRSRRFLCALVAGFSILSGSTKLEAEETVPEWFRFDAARPYAIFDAWKELSTRKASICLGENWQVLAGRLENERGEPIRNSPLVISHNTVIRGYSVRLQTDEHGYFIVYSPYAVKLGPRNPNGLPAGMDGSHVSATPGFPVSPAGQAFAVQCKAWRSC
jgi:hypothetical protein